MNRHWLLLLAWCTACQPMVNIGGDSMREQDDCGNVLATLACPAEPWGQPQVFTQEMDLRTHLVGRWAFCGGERKYTGRGPLSGLPGGSAIEFWEEGDQLRFAYLEGASRTRRQDVPWTGTVRLAVDGAQPRLWLVAGDAQEARWETQLYESQPVLRNSAFDVWNFVRLPAAP